MDTEVALIYRSKNFLLLVSLVLLILVSPLFVGTPARHLVFDALLNVVLLATVYAAIENRRTRAVALVLAIVAMALMWANYSDPLDPGRLAGLILYILLCLFAIGLVLRRIVLAPTVNFDVLCAGIGLYLLLGVTWALIFVVMDAIQPGAFESISLGLENDWTVFLYFSFATLTTLGYGDISPDSAVAQVWAVSEAVTGVLYLAVLVARLVSLYRE
ncbi:MAG: potassium channel family protein [Pseudomonadota bacterium]